MLYCLTGSHTVGYHGDSTIIPSGIPVHRPIGQTLPAGETTVLAFSFNDFELETAFITTDANVMEMIPINEAEDYIFGMVLLNDWSARDIQKWEYVPLGPSWQKFCIINITLVVTMDALEPFRVPSPNKIQVHYLICNKENIHSISI
jgi:fumarylacetoacetase